MRLAMILALVAALAGGWGAWQRADRIAAEAALDLVERDLRDAQAVIENQREVARVHRAHLARLQEREAATAQLLREIEQMEGGDALLSDYLDGAGRLLWP